MKTAYGILIGVVTTIFGIVVLVAFLQFDTHFFAKEHKDFVKNFALELSQTWEISKFEPLLSNEMLE